MKRQIVYVTGANGFIGRGVVERLCRDYWVVALLRPGSIPGFELNARISVVYGDLLDRASLRKTMPERAIVVNLAANPYHPQLSYQVNVGGVENLLMVAKAKRAKLFIQISSQATKINKQGVYAITKNASDNLVRQSAIPYVILKPSLVYGKGARGLFGKIQKLARQLPIVPIFGNGKTKVCPIHSEDFAEMIARAINEPRVIGRTFDVGGSAVSYNLVYAALTDKVIHIPIWIGKLVALACSWLPNPPLYIDNVLGSTQSTDCRPQPFSKLLSLTPRSFATGMREVQGKDKIKMAVVGLGKMGTLHLAILSTLSKVEIVALVDTNIQLFQTVKSMGIAGRFYASLGAAFAREKIDAVYILTPTFTHWPLMKEALSHRAHVFVEKPALLNAEQLREVRKMKTDKIIVHVGYTLLYGEIYRELKNILVSGKYGRVRGFRGRMEHAEVFGPKKGWMFNPQLSGGGVMMNPGPHFLALLNWFFGKPQRVEAEIKAKFVPRLDDQVKAKLSYPDFEGEIELDWGVKERVVPLNYFDIQCERARITTDGRKIQIKPRKGKLMTITKTDLTREEAIFDLNPQANGAAYYREDKAFVEAVERGTDGAVNTLKFAAEVESTIFEIYKKGSWR